MLWDGGGDAFNTTIDLFYLGENKPLLQVIN